ncbi:hypothetical protein J8273_8824 [Carpediemonas membranifera]|uniref:Uncharacterized protein n=1 Tax=Carpediemonas membranifera TaxID=201153 RepID=A0A8J6DYT1_9EUKA|nr:hypothetical protein J8273_8824 [Carpediemonas membranifera]|eukprot:KAG9389531.1 hypothetical protein J8273_8824 [Carpediemonas membranifera]
MNWHTAASSTRFLLSFVVVGLVLGVVFAEADDSAAIESYGDDSAIAGLLVTFGSILFTLFITLVIIAASFLLPVVGVILYLLFMVVVVIVIIAIIAALIFGFIMLLRYFMKDSKDKEPGKGGAKVQSSSERKQKQPKAKAPESNASNPLHYSQTNKDAQYSADSPYQQTPLKQVQQAKPKPQQAPKRTNINIGITPVVAAPVVTYGFGPSIVVGGPGVYMGGLGAGLIGAALASSANKKERERREAEQQAQQQAQQNAPPMAPPGSGNDNEGNAPYL